MKRANLSLFLAALTIGTASVVLSGCLPSQTPVETTKPAGNEAPSADQKSGTTTKTGMLTKVGEAFYLAEPGQEPKEINSYAVDLGEYVGQTVTVSGQYSGDTLYVGSIQVGQ